MLGLDFNLAAFNVFLRWRLPIFPDGQLLRAGRLARWLDDPSFDALALSELFDPRSRETLLGELAGAFPYRTRLVEGRGLTGNGGVMILSRWPIETDDLRVFEPRAPLEEGLVDKGFVYARIRKSDHVVHVFATHAYARFRPHHVRLRQLEALGAYVRERAIPAHDPVLFAGDLNVHRACEPDYRVMLDALEAHHPETIGHDATYDPAHNALARGSARLFLDYVLYSRNHRAPTAASNQVLRPRCEAWRHYPWQPPRAELSDHYPVIGRFRF